MKSLQRIAAAMAIAALAVAPAHAAVIGGGITGGTALTEEGAVFLKLNPPPLETGNNNQQSPNLFAFDEAQDIDIAAEVAVDIGANLQAGDNVASHLVIFDPPRQLSITGFILFDAPILAVITSTANLMNSDYLADSGVTYNSPALRGLEPNEDAAMIDPDNPYRLLLRLGANTPGDNIRVFTQAAANDVPEPMTFGLLGAGLVGIAGLYRRRVA